MSKAAAADIVKPMDLLCLLLLQWLRAAVAAAAAAAAAAIDIVNPYDLGQVDYRKAISAP